MSVRSAILITAAFLLGAPAVASAHPLLQRHPNYLPTYATQMFTVENEAHVPRLQLAHLERAVVDQSRALRRSWGTPVARFGAHGWPIRLSRHTGCKLYGTCVNGTPLFAGFHTTDDRWRPLIVVATRDLGGQPTWGITFSHEVLETLVDPSGGAYLKGYEREVCDPVGGVWYRVDGVRAADWITPAWFNYGRTFPAGTLFDAAGRVHDAGDDSLS